VSSDLYFAVTFFMYSFLISRNKDMRIKWRQAADLLFKGLAAQRLTKQCDSSICVSVVSLRVLFGLLRRIIVVLSNKVNEYTFLFHDPSLCFYTELLQKICRTET